MFRDSWGCLKILWGFLNISDILKRFLWEFRPRISKNPWNCGWFDTNSLLTPIIWKESRGEEEGKGRKREEGGRGRGRGRWHNPVKHFSLRRIIPSFRNRNGESDYNQPEFITSTLPPPPPPPPTFSPPPQSDSRQGFSSGIWDSRHPPSPWNPLKSSSRSSIPQHPPASPSIPVNQQRKNPQEGSREDR